MIIGRTDRTSIRNSAPSVALAIPGLALIRSTIPSWRTDPAAGSRSLSAVPVPHCETLARPNSWKVASCRGEGV